MRGARAAPSMQIVRESAARLQGGQSVHRKRKDTSDSRSRAQSAASTLERSAEAALVPGLAIGN
eukprot:12469468-Alexandrium_andersonii.AAC.1